MNDQELTLFLLSFCDDDASADARIETWVRDNAPDLDPYAHTEWDNPVRGQPQPRFNLYKGDAQ